MGDIREKICPLTLVSGAPRKCVGEECGAFYMRRQGGYEIRADVEFSPTGYPIEKLVDFVCSFVEGLKGLPEIPDAISGLSNAISGLSDE